MIHLAWILARCPTNRSEAVCQVWRNIGTAVSEIIQERHRTRANWVTTDFGTALYSPVDKRTYANFENNRPSRYRDMEVALARAS